MKKTITTSMMLLAMAATLSFGWTVQPASAIVADPVILDRLQDQRGDLLVRESQLLRDQDNLNKQIFNLKRINDPRNRFQLNDLYKQLDQTYATLQDVRYTIREIDQTLS
jgi:hypothetical protein